MMHTNRTASDKTQHGLWFLFSGLLFLSGPLSITGLNKFYLIILFLFCLFSWILKVAVDASVRIEPYQKLVIASYFLIFTIGLIAIIPSYKEAQGEYVSSVLPGRLFTLASVFIVFLAATDLINRASEKQLKILLFFGWLIGALFLVGALWQASSPITGIPFPVDTRDWMHGVPDVIKSAVPIRLTSFAEEPNFYAPLLIEFILISYFLMRSSILKKIVLITSLVVLVLTFSGGAYGNVFILAAISILITLLRVMYTAKISKLNLILLILVVILSIVLFFIFFNNIVFEFIIAKFDHESSGASSRSEFLASLVELWLKSNFLQMLIGHGIATMSILPEFGLSQNDFLFRITNNFFLDILWESGVLGVLSALTVFTTLIFKGIVANKHNKFNMLAFWLSFHVLITSLYRSEYLSPHFIWVLAIIFCSYRLGEMQLMEGVEAHD